MVFSHLYCILKPWKFYLAGNRFHFCVSYATNNYFHNWERFTVHFNRRKLLGKLLIFILNLQKFTNDTKMNFSHMLLVFITGSVSQCWKITYRGNLFVFIGSKNFGTIRNWISYENFRITLHCWISSCYPLYTFPSASFSACTVWCSEIGSLTSLGAPELHASSDVRESISLHQAVLHTQALSDDNVCFCLWQQQPLRDAISVTLRSAQTEKTLLNLRPTSASQMTKRPLTNRYKIECSCCCCSWTFRRSTPSSVGCQLTMEQIFETSRNNSNNYTRFCIDLLMVSLSSEMHSLVSNSIKSVVMRVQNKILFEKLYKPRNNNCASKNILLNFNFKSKTWKKYSIKKCTVDSIPLEAIFTIFGRSLVFGAKKKKPGQNAVKRNSRVCGAFQLFTKHTGWMRT